MRSVVVSVLAVAGFAAAQGPPGYHHGGDNWGSSEEGSWGSTTSAAPVMSTWSTSASPAPVYSTWSTSAAPVMSSAPPYPVPGGNSTWGPTATQVPPASSPAAVCSEYVDGQPQCASGTPAPSAPAATGAAGALTVGFGAALAGIAAFVL